MIIHRRCARVPVPTLHAATPRIVVQSVDEGVDAAFFDPVEPDLESLVVLDELEELESGDLEADSVGDELPSRLLDFPPRASFL